MKIENHNLHCPKCGSKLYLQGSHGYWIAECKGPSCDFEFLLAGCGIDSLQVICDVLRKDDAIPR